MSLELIADHVWAQLEHAAVSDVGWFNDRRLHSSIGTGGLSNTTRVLGAPWRSGSSRF